METVELAVKIESDELLGWLIEEGKLPDEGVTRHWKVQMVRDMMDNRGNGHIIVELWAADRTPEELSAEGYEVVE